MKEITDRVAAFARGDRYLSNNPPAVTFNGFQAEGYVLQPGSEAEAVLARAHETAIGSPLKTFTSPSYLDCRVYSLYDKIPALCYGPITEGVHGFDERCSISSLKKITTAMALFIAEWCGVEAVST
jgi:acetylornithine deacetylase